MNNVARASTGLGLAALLTLTVSACGTTASPHSNASSPPKPQVLRWTLGDEVSLLDPEKTTDDQSFEVINDAMEGLMRVGPDQKPVPGLASKCDVSTDGMTYTFHLRDTKWSNGTPVTASDFVYGWKRLLDPKTGAGYAYIMTMIRGADAYHAGRLKDFSQVGVKALDPHTLQVQLRFPCPYFLDLTAFIPFYPANQTFVEKVGSAYGTTPSTLLSDGPFIVKDWKPGYSISLKKNPSYWDHSNVRLNELDFQIVKDPASAVNLYETNRVDVAGLSAKYVPLYKDKPGFGTLVSDAVFFIEFNHKKAPVLQNADIRQALSLAIDRKQFCAVALNDGSMPALGLVPPSIPGDPAASGDFRSQNGALIADNDSAKAKQLLASGLASLGLKTMPALHFLVDDSVVGKSEATLLQAAWSQNLGITVQIDSVPFKTLIGMQRSGDYEMTFAGWSGDYNDPMTFLDLWTSRSPANSIGYSSAHYDQDIASALAQTDPSKRMQDLLDAERTFLRDMPVAPVYFQGRAHIQRTTVHDVYRFATGASPEFKWAYVN